MKTLSFTACLFFCFTSIVSPAQNKELPKTYAVIIGIAHYQNPALPILKYADNDAGLFATYLQSKAGGNVPVEQIKLLLNDKATISAVYDAFDWLKETCKKNDRVFIYFSGHGDLETKNHESLGYLLAYNTPPNNYVNNAVSITNLNNTANALTLHNGAKVIIISDACHAGKLAGDFFKGKQFAAASLNKVLNNEVRLAACAANEEAAEGPDWGGGRGVFSYYLLNGLNNGASTKNNDSIRLSDLAQFLNTSFSSDKYLIAGKHKQTPVTDGNSSFALAIRSNTPVTNTATINNTLPEGLQAFTALKAQPVDYFFEAAEALPLENMIDFTTYDSLSADSLPFKLINDCIAWQKKTDSLQQFNDDDSTINYSFSSIDSLVLLQQQLANIKTLPNVFKERFVELVQDKSQDMINAYLAGDAAELEKRQYYFGGGRAYSSFLAMLQKARQIISPDHYLAHVLEVNNYYLTGLISRLNMATSTNTNSLLNDAFINQTKALSLEPYAAYIHNELGNLYLHRKQFDSADYHFSLDTILAPTWSIPWSNKIRLYVAENDTHEAMNALHHADSLQPNLSFTLINAGLAMEKSGNLLAAETLYKKAIKRNNIHYLPYERLGHIYLRTGDFIQADKFLYDAQLRKQEFAINENYFTYGVELGGANHFDSSYSFHSFCQVDSAKLTAQQQPYFKLEKALQNIYSPNLSTKEKEQRWQSIIKQFPFATFAHHYLGKIFYEDGNFESAEIMLQKAVSNYSSVAAVKNQLSKILYGNKVPADSCLLVMLMNNYKYDVLDDYYMLGEIYMQQNQFEKAARQYAAILVIENQRQNAQAVFKDYDNMLPIKDEAYRNIMITNPERSAEQAFGQPIPMGGSLKLARLYEQQQQFEKAEKVLLKQIEQNRAAGFARQTVMEKHPVVAESNNYWLLINHDFEGETYNFYKRVTELFPRDYKWQQKAGLFLYRRLALTYAEIPVEQYKSFTDNIVHFYFPFVITEQDPRLYRLPDSVIYFLPVTKERMLIPFAVYNPVKEALNWLQQSGQLSPNILPDAPVAEAIAGINSWMDNEDTAVAQYEVLLQRQPLNTQLRNKFIDYVTAIGNLSAAVEQLDVLYHNKTITREQLLTLGEYNIFSGNNKAGYSMIKAYHPHDSIDLYNKKLLIARLHLMQADKQKALNYYKDSLWEMPQNSDDDDLDFEAWKQEENCLRSYAIAKLYALQGDNDSAFTFLSQALANGFTYKYVLENDTALSTLRNDERWHFFLSIYDLNKYYKQGKTKVFTPSVFYWIPDLHNQQQ